MAFPTNPTQGDTHIEHGETWVFTGDTWSAGGLQVQSNGRVIFFDDEVPVEASDDSVWYRHDISSVAKKVAGEWANIPSTVSIGDLPTEPEEPAPEEPTGGLFVATVSGEGTTENRSWTVTLTPSAGATGTTATWNWTGIQSADLDPSSSFGTDISGVWTFFDDTTPMNFQFDFIQDDGIENETGYFNILETGDSFPVFIRDRESF